MNKTTKYLVGLAGAMALLASAQASATLINFEDAPSLGLLHNGVVTTQYSSEGVTFSGGYLEKKGGAHSTNANPQGFLWDHHNVYDTAAPGYKPATGATGAGSYGLGLGNWFLRTGGTILSRGGHGVYLTVDYTTAVSAASGQIWDIDGSNAGSEQWKVVAYLNGVAVASVTSPLGTNTNANSLNGKPWSFNLSYLGGFNSLEFEFIGSKTRNIGLGFDNFNTDALFVPEPAVLGMFGLGTLLVGLFAGLRRRREA